MKNETFIIAEIGINHNGSLKIAKDLILMAKAAGCDAVKFQKRDINTVYTEEELNKPRKSPWGNTQRNQKEGLEFSKKEYDEINQFCKSEKVNWFASAWDIKSLEFLDQYNLKYNKIASAMITHLEFLKQAAKRKKYTFISTGMSGYAEIDKATNIFKQSDCPFELMHSVSAYPAPEDQLNLNLIKKLKEKYNCDVGYSGHESSVSPSIIAFLLGANYIERHITLDRSMWGTDQAASLSKTGMENLSSILKKAPDIVGNGVKVFSKEERKMLSKFKYWN